MDAILNSLSTDKVKLKVYRGKNLSIEHLEPEDGAIYFAYDSGKIFLDKEVTVGNEKQIKRFLMSTSSGGGGNSGFVYAAADMNAGTLVKIHSNVDNIDSPGYYIYRQAFNFTLQPTVKTLDSGEELQVYSVVYGTEDEQSALPDIDTLIINSNGWIFRVVEQQGTENRVVANIVSTGSGSGGGGGSSSEDTDDLSIEWGEGWGSYRTYVYGQDNPLTVTGYSTRDREVSFHFVIQDVINNKILLDDTVFQTSGKPYTFNTNILPESSRGIKISVYLDSTSSRMYDNYKPKGIFDNITVFRMDLTKVDPDEYLPLRGDVANGIVTQDLRFIPTGSSSAEVYLHVTIDGAETSVTKLTPEVDGKGTSVKIGRQSHGKHNIDLQLSTNIGGVDLYSNILTYQAAWVVEGETSPIIWIGNYDSLVTNYENSYIKYMVFDPLITANDNGMEVSLYKDGETTGQVFINGLTATDWFTWDITSLYNAPEGEETVATIFSIARRGVKVDVTVNVTGEGARDLSLVAPDSLMINISTAGRSNNEVAATRGIISSSVSNLTAELYNFNWQNNGWGIDNVGLDGIDNGSYLTIANGASMVIPFSTILLNDAKGKDYSFELRFRIRNVQQYSTLVRTIPVYYYVDENGVKSSVGKTEAEIAANPNWTIYKDADGNTEMDTVHSQKVTETENGIVVKWLNEDNLGFCLGTQEAYFRTPSGVANVRYAEDQVINISFVVSMNDALCYVYLNGILSGAVDLPDPQEAGSTFRMDSAFYFNSEYCDLDLYRFRVYQTGLTMPDVIHNYLSDMHNIKLYDQNNLTRKLDDTELDYDTLVKYNTEHPGQQTMPYAVWTIEQPTDTDILPQFKGNKKKVTVDFVNPSLDEALENGDISEWFYYTHCPSFHAEGAEINVQGTSSQKYPRRNFKIKYKKATTWVYTKGSLEGKSILKAYEGILDDTNEPHNLSKNFHVDNESFGTNQFTWKIDYMESSGSYNTGFANLMGNLVHPLYSKHPLDDIYGDGAGTDMRTTVYGFPVLTFQKYITDAKNTYNDGYTYKYIGRYNMNLDKSSNEYYGFEYSGEHPYIDSQWDEYKEVTQKDSEGHDVIGEDGEPIKVQEFVRTHQHPLMKDVAECWELRDNQGTWCSFRYPNDAARSAGFQTLVDGTSGENAQLEVIKHFEYRYTNAEDQLDAAYEYSNFVDENGVERNSNALINNYLLDKYGNLEKLFNWLDSTDTQNATNNSLPNGSVGPWQTANECTGVGEHSEAVFTYVPVGNSALFDDNEQYFVYDSTTNEYTQVNISSLFAYRESTEIKRNTNYFYLDNENYIGLSKAQITNPFTGEFISPEANYKFKIYNYEKTSDIEVLPETKTYFTYANNVYTKVDNPVNEELDQYYEAIKADTAITLYEAYRPSYYVKAVNYYNTTFNNDTVNYRLAKFRKEFEEHLDKEYCLVYFILTELLLCYDSRGKNMMLASFGPKSYKYTVANDVTAENYMHYFVRSGNNYVTASEDFNSEVTYYRKESGDYIWYPTFYDIDTQLGLNNSGAYLWDYDADVTTDNIFSTPNSVLWNNFYTVFYNDIVSKYRSMRSQHLNESNIIGAYECDAITFNSYAMRGIRPTIAIGLDEYYKYLAPTSQGYWPTSGDYAKFRTFIYAYACQGDKKLTTELLIKNRLNYMDSQWLAGDYTAAKVLTEIFIRANANLAGTSDSFLDSTSYNNDQSTMPEAAINRGFSLLDYSIDNGLDAKAGYKIKPFLHQSVTYFVDNQPVAPVRYDGQIDGIRTNVSPDVIEAYKKTLDVSQQINYIPAADYISSLGDLSLTYPNAIQIYKGKRLLDLNIGSDNPDYYNSQLNAQSDFSIADLPLLRTANFSRLTDFGRAVSLAASAKLEEFKALDSTLTTVNFAPGAPLHTVLLPRTLTILTLIEHERLNKILTSKPEVIKKVNGEYIQQSAETYRGLYIEGVTDIGNNSGTGHNLFNITIRGGKLEYGSYEILRNLITLKDGARVNNTLSINLYDVHWSPYSLVEVGTPYNSNITYYELTDHSSFISYSYVDALTWEQQLLNERIYTYDNTAPKATIQNLNLLNKFIEEYVDAKQRGKINQFYGEISTQATMPIITGQLYVDNSAWGTIAIDEQTLTSVWKLYYPNLQITAANINEANITKYVNILDNGKEEIVDIKRSNSNHPLQLDALAPTKTNYDFKGWALDKDGQQMFVTYDYTTGEYADFETALNSYTFTSSNKILTLYAIFEIHNFVLNFYNNDNTLLETVVTPYNVLAGLPEPAVVPMKVGNVDFDKVYKWAGWARRSNPNTVVDLSKITSTADIDFVAVYEDVAIDVHNNVFDNKYFTFLEREDGYWIGLNPDYDLMGKVTLPTMYNNRVISGIWDFSSNKITHIFWQQENQGLKTIFDSAFDSSALLQYYEQQDVTEGMKIGTTAFARCPYLGVDNPNVIAEILEPVSILAGNSIFLDTQLQEVTLPGHAYTQIDNGAFRGFRYTRVLNIGSESDPCQWDNMIGNQLNSTDKLLLENLGRMINYASVVNIYRTTTVSTEQDPLRLYFGLNPNIPINQIVV